MASKSRTAMVLQGFDSLGSSSLKTTHMKILIEKEREKNFLSCTMCNKYTLTTEIDGVSYSQAYYGYPKRLAISSFKKYVKSEIKLLTQNNTK
jgi:hypothetical protein